MSSSVRWPKGGGNWQSQQLTHSENRTMKGRGTGKSHSWWWDSHNAPKNSKWLEDNLNDMDSKVKSMLKLIEEDADSFAKRAEMYYKKRPELIILVEEFYRAYRSLAERYDQLTGHIRQIPQEIQAQFGFSGDAPPGSPGSGSVRRRAAGFSMFNASPGTPKHSKEKGRKDGSDSSSSSSSDSDSDSKGKPKQSDELLRFQEENEQLQKDIDKGVAQHQALESRLAELQEELKSLQHQNAQLHRNAASSHSEIASLEAEIERLKRENLALGEEASSAVRTAEKLQKELDLSQNEQQQLSIRLEDTNILMQNLKEKIEELEARITQLKEELLSSTASCKRLEQEIATVLEERSALLDDVSGKAGRIIELEEEIARLQASLSLSDSERNKHFELHQSLKKTLADVHVECSTVREEKGKLSEELLFKVQHVQSLEQQLKQVQATLEGSERERTDVVERLNKVESRLLDLQNEFGSVQERLTGEICVQEDEKNAYKKQVEELKAALAALHTEKSRGVELQDIMAKRLTDLELQLREAKGALESSEKEKTEVSGLLREVKSSFLKLEGEFGSMEVKLNVEVLEKRALNTQVEELQAALEALQGERSQGLELQRLLEKQLEDLELQLKQVQEALEASDKEKLHVNRLLSELESKFSKLQYEFGSIQNELTGKISVHAQDKQVLKEQVENLQAALAALHGDRTRGIELHDVLEKRLMGMEKQLAQVQAALEQAEIEKAEVGGLLSKADVHLKELQAELISVQARLSKDLSALSQEKQVLIEQVEELKGTLAAFQGEKSRGVELQDILEKQLKQLQLELSQSKHEASCLSDELAEKTGAILRLEGAVRSRDDAVHRLQLDLSAKQEEGKSLKIQLEECSKDLQTFETEVQKLRALLIESENLARTLEAQIIEIQQNFELEKIEFSKLRVDLEAKVAIIGRLEGEVQNRDILRAALQDEISAKREEVRVLKEEMSALIREKTSLSEESLLKLEKIALLQKELEETLETLAERRNFLLNLETENKRLTKDLFESQQKTAHHVSQWQLVTSDKDRLKLELILLQEANSKLQEELSSRISQVEKLMLDLKISEETISVTKEENVKLTVDLDLEVTRSRKTDKKCLLQEQVICDLQEGKSKLVAQVEDSELSISKLQEEIKNLKVYSKDTCQEKNALEVEVQGLRDELSKVNQMNKEQSSQQLEMISYLKIEINRLEVHLANGTAQLQVFEKEQEVWNKERVVLDESINQLTKEKQELQDAVLMWSERIEKLQSEHTTLRTSSRDVESSLLFHQTEHSRLKSELSEKSERILWLEEELKRLQTELMSSQEDTRQLSIELQQATQHLKDQLLAEKGKVRLLHDDIDRLQQDLLSAQKARETEAIVCQEHVKVFQIKEESLESQILKLKRELHDLDELCKELARKLKDETKEQEVLKVEKEKLRQDLLKTRQQQESAEEKCGTLASELVKEHDSRVTAEAACVKFEAETTEQLKEIARLQAELLKLKEANESLTAKVEAALEQERIDAMEIEGLLRALQSEHEENGSPTIGELSWHFQAKHSTFRHLKESVVNLLTDKSRIKQEAAAHAEHVKVLNLEIAKSGQLLDTTKGDYQTLSVKHESSLAELGAFQLRISQFEGQVQVLEEEKKKLHDQLLASTKDSDNLSAELLKEKKELYEKLVAEGEHVLKLQKELKMIRAESVENRMNIDDLDKQIQKLLLNIHEISEAKEEQEKRLSQEIQRHVEEKATAVQSLTEALGALSIEKAEVLRHQDAIFFKDQQLVKLEEEIALLRASLLEKEQKFLELQQQKDSFESQIGKLEESHTFWQEEKSSLSSSLTLNEKKAMELLEKLGLLTKEKEEISLELQARVVSLDSHQVEIQRLQKLLDESDVVSIRIRDEKTSLSEQHALSLGRCNELEALCKSLQKELAEHQLEKRQYEAQLSVIEELREKALDDEEMVRLMHERVASKQQEIDHLQSINEDLKGMMRKFESEMESLKDQIIILQKKNKLLNEEVSMKVSLVKELDQNFTSLKEKKVVFEGGVALAVGNVGLVQAEVDKLLGKVSKLSELSVSTEKNKQTMEERICKLQVSNLNLRDEISGLAKKEKSYVIAVRFMRAEFFCLVQRIKAMKEEKAEVAMSAELAVEAERKKNGEILSGLNQELAFLREENKRQRTIVFDRAEEKREAIRQLCATIEFMQTKNRRLEGVIISVREKIQRRIAASNARR